MSFKKKKVCTVEKSDTQTPVAAVCFLLCVLLRRMHGLLAFCSSRGAELSNSLVWADGCSHGTLPCFLQIWKNPESKRGFILLPSPCPQKSSNRPAAGSCGPQLSYCWQYPVLTWKGSWEALGSMQGLDRCV